VQTPTVSKGGGDLRFVICDLRLFIFHFPFSIFYFLFSIFYYFLFVIRLSFVILAFCPAIVGWQALQSSEMTNDK